MQSRLVSSRLRSRRRGGQGRRTQGSKFVLIALRVYYLQYMLPNLGRDTSSGSKGSTTATSLVQSLSRDVGKEARNAGKKDGADGEREGRRV